MPRSMISQGEDSILLVRAFISRTDRNGWQNNLDLLAGVRPQSEVECSTGVRPQSKVAGDCTLAPDPRGCALRGRRKMCARPEGLRLEGEAKDVRQTQGGVSAI